MASSDDSPVRIVEEKGENAILIIPGKMANWVWYETKLDDQKIMVTKTSEFEILVKKKNG